MMSSHNHAHLELLQEVFPQRERGGRVAQDHLKLVLEAQFVSDVREPLLGDQTQRWGGHAQEHHVTMVAGAPLGRAEQALDDLQRLHGSVLLQVRLACRHHQGHGVVLDQDVGADHGAVQLGKPAAQQNKIGQVRSGWVGVVFMWTVNSQTDNRHCATGECGLQ